MISPLQSHNKGPNPDFMFYCSFAVMQRFMGALNFREQLRSRISPCGSFVISGSEDASAYVWNAETGKNSAQGRSQDLENGCSKLAILDFWGI